MGLSNHLSNVFQSINDNIMRKLISNILFITSLLLLCSCQRTADPRQSAADHASGFRIEHRNDTSFITFYTNNTQSTIHNNTDSCLFAVPDAKPYRRLITTSVTHVGLLQAIGADSCIAGVCDKDYLYTPVPWAEDIGSSLNLDAERILHADADLVLLTYSGDSRSNSRLETFGLPTLMINEWREQNPLARAEWVRVFGVLTGHRREADSVYNEVVQRYNELRDLVEAQQHLYDTKVKIMSGAVWQGTWYVPDGNTYMAQLFRDAGAEYKFTDGTGSSSLPLSFEQALLDFQDADVWVGAPVTTLSELRQRDEKNTWFKAYKDGRVYNFSRRTRGDANDFWQLGVVHPELILSDLINIVHIGDDSMLFFSTGLR